MMDDEREGGDPPCWAHLFADEPEPAPTAAETPAPAAAGPNLPLVGAVDLLAVAQRATADGAAWAQQCADLNVNLLAFRRDGGVAEHVNAEVDVLLVGIAGKGVVELNGESHPLAVAQALLVPKGARRAIRATSDRFAYLSCHRRRSGLWPSRGPHPDHGTPPNG